jgi:transcriptional regulator with GAF, ATPase, and Fis domain
MSNLRPVGQRDAAPGTSNAADAVSTTMPPGYVALVSGSPAMQSIKRIVDEVAPTTATVMIRGESGVGKDVVARAIALASGRAGAFIKVNCAALPSELLESELFGHEKGAFTGAYRRKLGKFEFADRGTLWLDEIAELPLALQAKLLHVLQDHEFYRIGGRELISVDARIIASTNRDVEESIARGAFREDLYYRLNVVEIQIPPLRERREEIQPLAVALFQRYRRRPDQELPGDILDMLVEYDWPGNVRELENIVRRLAVLGQVPRVLDEVRRTLCPRRPSPPPLPRSTSTNGAPVSPESLAKGLREIARLAAQDAERRALKQVLDEVRWNRTAAAGILKVSYKTLLAKIAEYDL